MIVKKGVCIKVTPDALGIIKENNNDLIFVADLLEGEEATYQTTKFNNHHGYATILERHNSSPFRLNPKCGSFLKCGSCNFLHLDYQKELEIKKELVISNFLKIANMKVSVNDVISKNSDRYRYKMQVPITSVKNPKYGFYKKRSHELVSFNDCVLAPLIMSDVVKYFTSLLKEFKIPGYDEDKQLGKIRHLILRLSKNQDEMLLIVVSTDLNIPNFKNMCAKLIEKFPLIKSIVLNKNSRKTNVILGEDLKIVYGQGYINDYLHNIKFRISAKSFYQVNPVAAETLYLKALSLANLKKTDILLDCYSGIGLIGLLASSQVKEVVCVDNVKEAIIDGINTAKRNEIHNIKYITEDATRYIASTKTKFDVIVLDPPRSGLDSDFVTSLLYSKCKSIIYISCDSATLARDIKILSSKYIIQAIQPLDMFPRTSHIETIVKLTRIA